MRKDESNEDRGYSTRVRRGLDGASGPFGATAIAPVPPDAITAEMVLQMLAIADRTGVTGVISIGDDGAPRVETATEAFAADREAVSEHTAALRWNDCRPFTRQDAERYAAYLTSLL